ncbi:hypothetical protein J437_LFUL004515 [Ladona fulva]|uniref:Succinate dehydrogenase cytochrome b560 subunit, mitochondrial n=1 Tax=Ladona fulva TaxID=123851 RepID=A0A8K0P2G7_LADFU|nr:hypothetical protein J437_LFUL004515 [Ladona fulva]
MAFVALRGLSCRSKSGVFFQNLYKTQFRPVTLKVTTVKKDTGDETFFQRNERLNRPLSPHLTIYKPQLTSLLSLSHRATGMIMSGYMYAFGIGVLALPSTFPHFIEGLGHVSPGVVFILKLGVAFPFAYHYCNGVRHLLWDLGKGLKLKEVYQSGYAVLGSSAALALLLTFL